MELENLTDFIQNIISQIKLSDNVQEHLTDTENEIVKYLNLLSSYSQEAINTFLMDATIKENYSSAIMENALFSKQILWYYQEELSQYPKLTKPIISNLSKAVLANTDHPNAMAGIYRDCIAWVGRPGCTIETASFVPPKECYIEPLMEQLIDYYNEQNESQLDNPLIKSAILHILFIKIHPFKDGNGRIARILHHHKLTELLNQKYNFDFKLPIINLSQHLELSRGNYYQNENDIIFDSKIQNNDVWNKWFNYVLNMIDEQVYFLKNRLQSYDDFLKRITERQK